VGLPELVLLPVPVIGGKPMRRDTWLLLAALLAAGCQAEEGDHAVEQARARLTAAPAAPALGGAPQIGQHVAAPAKPAPQAVDPKPTGAPAAPAADPAPAAGTTDPPGADAPAGAIGRVPTAADVKPVDPSAPLGELGRPENDAPLQAQAALPAGLAERTAPPSLAGDLRPNVNPGAALEATDDNPDAPPGTKDVLPLGADQQMALDFPWANANGGPWNGTGSPDPEPLKKVSDADIVKAALNTSPEGHNDRLSAMVSAARRHLPSAMSIIQTALADKDEFTREIAVSALIEHGGPAALPLMWQALERDPSPLVRGAAIWAVALYGPEEGLKAINAGLSDRDPAVQGMAVLATTSLRDLDKVFSICEAASQSDQLRVYQHAAYVLGNVETRRAMEDLAKVVRETKDPVKQRTFAYYLKHLQRRAPQLLLPMPQR
jgi:hypothetical protein